MEHIYWKLEIWKRSVDLATGIYSLTKKFPKQERYGLTSQMRRCSVSISSNIAEGSSRTTNKHFAHFLAISRGSLYELQTQLTIAFKLNYLPEDEFRVFRNELLEISNMIYKFRTKHLTF